MSQTTGEAELVAGNELFVQEEFHDAAQQYTSAITKTLGIAAFPALFGRGRCNMIAQEFGAATTDFQECVSLKPNHPLSNFYLGLCLCEQGSLPNLERAYNHLLRARKSNRDDPRFKEHLARCKARIEQLSPKSEIIQPSPESKEQSTEAPEPARSAPSEDVVMEEVAVNGDARPPAPPQPQFRDTWTQNPSTITFVIYAKNFTPDRINISFTTRSVDVQLNLEDGSVYHRSLALTGEIDTGRSSWRSNKFKISIFLQKSSPGKWDALENELDDGEERRIGTPWTTKRDWSGVDRFASEELEKEKPEGEQALQSLFQKIYKDADEDQRRAMIKSFQTSGGTVLSTNWDDVADKDYEGRDAVLPTDQHVKKWEY